MEYDAQFGNYKFINLYYARDNQLIASLWFKKKNYCWQKTIP